MENSTTEFRSCPHCGERLVAGATICLHCNEEVTAQTVETDGALKRFFLIAFILIGAVGAVSVVVVNAVTDKVEKQIPQAKTFEEDGLLCVAEDDASKVAALEARGLSEVKGKKPGHRCFQP